MVERMRTPSTAMVILLMISSLTPMLLSIQSDTAQGAAASAVKWTRYAQNPILSQGGSGSWESACIACHCVINDGGTYKMWYGGSTKPYQEERIGYATSADGKSWTKYASNPVLGFGGAGSWDSAQLFIPVVIKDGGTYKMWYGGSNGNIARIGYATSPDGIAWTKYAGNPVLDVSTANPWDSKMVAPGTVIKENDEYKLWYQGSDGTRWELGYASSPDGISWTKYAGNPILQVGIHGNDWDNSELGHFTVVNASGTYRGWYAANDMAHWAIGTASSPDGMTWTKYARNPVLSWSGNAWESHDVMCPWVIFNGTCYQMWYAGVNAASSPWVYKYGYAEGINPALNPPVLTFPPDQYWTNQSKPQFSWAFNDTDPGDVQGSYQLQIGDDGDFISVRYDSGRVTSAAGSHTMATPIPEGIYYWRVQVWTADDELSGWSPPRIIGIDTTPPRNPTDLLSQSHGLARWNNHPIVNVQWSLPSGGGDISGYNGFSTAWDSSALTVPDATVDIGSDILTVQSPSMPDGDNYYFHIRAKDNAGNWNAAAAHIGPFWIDSSPPSNPGTVLCTDHVYERWSGNMTVNMTWSEADASISGVEGYSYLWDNEPYTMPPSVVLGTAKVLNATSGPLADGDSWHFHIRTRDNAGNWAITAAHRGPYYIDATPPMIINFTINNGDAIASSRILRLGTIVEDPEPGSGVSHIRVRTDNSSWTPWQVYKDVLMFQLNGDNGNRSIHIQVRDRAGNPSLEAGSTIFLDTMEPSGIFIMIDEGKDFTNDTSVVLAIWAEDPAPGSGVQDMALSNDDINWGDWESFRQARSYSLAPGDGKKTVYLRVRDRAGNICATGNASIILDGTPPTCSISQLPPTVDDRTFSVGWNGTDSTSGISAYDIQYRKDAGDWTDWVLNMTMTRENFTGEDGHNYSFRIRAQDRAGNRGAYPVTASASTRIDIPGPVVTILRPAPGALVSGRYTIKGTASHPKADLSVVQVRVQLDDRPWRNASGTGNWSSVLDSMTLSNGRHSLRVSAFDGAKYSKDATLEFNVENKVTISENMLLWAMLMIVISMVVVLAVFIAKRRKREPLGPQSP